MSWINETSQESLQSKPPKRKHQSNAGELVIEDRIIMLLIVITISSFEHDRCGVLYWCYDNNGVTSIITPLLL